MIKENIAKIRERIGLVCSRVNRDYKEITIIAVSKGRSAQEIEEAIEVGITDIGENRIQEAILKYNDITSQRANAQRIKWHMVGHLQTNKVKEAVKIFDLIQSVDSLRLAQEIDKQAAKINKIQDILIEVNVAQEASKFGLKPEETIPAVKEINKLKNVNIKGLMTIAPIVDHLEESRPYFKKLKELLEELNARRTTHYALRILSMGMSDDFEVAIEEGANMLRLGRAIFEY
ncbi:MAG: YggS family pyridoxal phosphate-dependent enzyme [Candidatus Omnitrophica bacterium]|nr:YggS family pyridoxal phosphate-dependent enzyme [Candidatus Omnitrophota bacterium]